MKCYQRGSRSFNEIRSFKHWRRLWSLVCFFQFCMYVSFSSFIISLILPGFSGLVILNALLVRSDTITQRLLFWALINCVFSALKWRESSELEFKWIQNFKTLFLMIRFRGRWPNSALQALLGVFLCTWRMLLHNSTCRASKGCLCQSLWL